MGPTVLKFWQPNFSSSHAWEWVKAAERRKMGAGSIHENGFSIKLGTHCMELAPEEIGPGWNLHCFQRGPPSTLIVVVRMTPALNKPLYVCT